MHNWYPRQLMVVAVFFLAKVKGVVRRNLMAGNQWSLIDAVGEDVIVAYAAPSDAEAGVAQHQSVVYKQGLCCLPFTGM